MTEGDVDLGAFRTIGDVRGKLGLWLKVREMLDGGQMPPKDASQPTDPEREQMRHWLRDYLAGVARAQAGDPGPVMLRRLTNAEYNHTVRDLTGVESLNPTREFPIDGAAGEGFTNVGAGQGMSPALVQKYLDAAKEVAGHAVLLPDGIRFSPRTTRRDQTDELKGRIQAFYRRFTADGGGTTFHFTGKPFTTNQGGRLPIEAYLAATLAERKAIRSGTTSLDEVAGRRNLSAKYLGILWQALTADDNPPSPLLEGVRRDWRAATAADAPALAAGITEWQSALWKFNTIGHIGREGGATQWMEPVTPIRTSQELRFDLPKPTAGGDVTVYLAASDLGDGNEQDFVIWRRPRIEFTLGESGVPPAPVLLRDVRSLVSRIGQSMAKEVPRTPAYLAALVELSLSQEPLKEVAVARGLDADLLANWSSLTGIGSSAKREITGRFTEKLTRFQGYEAVNGWGTGLTPSLLTNRSTEPVQFLTLTVPARGVTVHPSPTVDVAVVWQSPVDAEVRVKGRVADADNKCGNGAAWRVELQSKSGQRVLAEGLFDNGGSQPIRLDTLLEIETGDAVSLIVNARDGSHVCDTTHVELSLLEVGGEERVWNLATDVVNNVLQGNPLPDAYGHPDTWHFCRMEGSSEHGDLIPPESALAQWRSAINESDASKDLDRLAAAVQNVLTGQDNESPDEPNALLRRRLLDWRGPLNWLAVSKETVPEGDGRYGLDPASFGHHPNGAPLDEADLCLQAPHTLKIRLPAQLASGAQLVAAGLLHSESGREGSVQLQVLTDPPARPVLSPTAPVLVHDGSTAQRRMDSAMDEFRQLFPPTLCYARIVPVDEVVTLTLFHREDDHLKRLMLDDAEASDLDRLWDELTFVSREPLELVVVFEQISEFATQDRPDLVKAFTPMRQPILDRADAFRRRMSMAEARHVTAVIEFADRAWRRRLSDSEQQSMADVYRQLRESEIPHSQAIRLLLARVLAAPAFLYKLEQPPPGDVAAPVSSYELATRLSYFLWSSLPDDRLRRAAEEGKLAEDDVLVGQTRRMLQDARTRRLAVHFACHWLHLQDFDQQDDKNEKLYPEFASLRSDMYEETVRFFADLFRNDGSILDLLAADHTFLNESLARHYGIEGVAGQEWRRVGGLRANGRGGILGMATVLASQSGASRTSPILRGNWVSETLLGERLPKPPAGVPQLPETVPSGLTARQMIERHTSVPECAKCHRRIDPYGFALEQFDTIGGRRAGIVDTRTTLIDGTEIDGLDGLRGYLLGKRRDDFVRQFCRKLLGFALGREVQLSDEPLLDEIAVKLKAYDFRFRVAVEAIVTSRQFREIRGQSRHDDGS